MEYPRGTRNGKTRHERYYRKDTVSAPNFNRFMLRNILSFSLNLAEHPLLQHMATFSITTNETWKAFSTIWLFLLDKNIIRPSALCDETIQARLEWEETFFVCIRRCGFSLRQRQSIQRPKPILAKRVYVLLWFINIFFMTACGHIEGPIRLRIF